MWLQVAKVVTVILEVPIISKIIYFCTFIFKLPNIPFVSHLSFAFQPLFVYFES